ncbi:isopentenyl-diphosphate delta-isomerase [Bradyrhizobium canariense]|nr:isopentenyl-diphosphate delta-isomerase [Bradyrhizobium canariense]MCS3765750.1 isopentenyl-diphosphate delta-isomerase [Bradyrhizobium centrosematis]MCS3777976.1 isopentenyl-diphosphate delta-isomerase [Bradyrhizobium centrosematis]
MSDTALSRCKDDYLDIVLGRRTAPATLAGGWKYIGFEHCALPDFDLAHIERCAWLLARLCATRTL